MKKMIILVLTAIVLAVTVVSVANQKTEVEISPNFATVVKHSSRGIITSDGILYKDKHLYGQWQFLEGDMIRFIKSSPSLAFLVYTLAFSSSSLNNSG